MRSLARHAAEPLSRRPLCALLAALAALAGTPAAAQSDPFALPEGLTAQSVKPDDGPRLSEIVVDGRPLKRMVTVEGSGKALTIDAENARVAGLPVPDGATGAIRLDTLNIYEWKFDELRQRLSITLFREGDRANVKDFASRIEQPSESRPLLALRVDYDLTATVGSGRATGGGLVEATAVYGNFSVGTGMRLATDPQNGSPAVLRLDSGARLAMPEKGLAVTAGDFVSAGSESQRALRMGGIQIASDFNLRPDLVTIPLPAFSGRVAVPTTVDILSADQRYQAGELEPGDFTIRNLPSQPGRGEASVILRDALGREVVETTRFYVSRDLLAPKTTGYAVNAGFVRRRYGLVSNDYGQFAASGYIRRGLSPRLTVEGSGEYTAGLINVGARADMALGGIALVTGELRYSRDSVFGSGNLLDFALESIGRNFGGSIGATLPSANYRDVAARLGDAPPPKQLQAQVFYRPTSKMEFQLSYARQEYRAVPGRVAFLGDNEVINANFRWRMSSRATFFAGGGVRRANGESVASAAVGLSINLGPRTNAGAFANYDGGRISGGANYAKDAIRDGEFGYRASASVSETSQRVSGGATWRDRRVLLDAQVEEIDGRFAARAGARGTLLVAGGTVFARNQSGGSYALVRTGKVGGVPITRENQQVGSTNERGMLLVQNIPAQAAIKIDVDADKLPADALVRETTKWIKVPQRAVTLVEIDTLRFVPVIRKLVDARGRPLPAGSPVRAVPSGEESFIGFDGMAELNAASGDDRLQVGRPGATCTVELRGVDLERDGEAPLVCESATVAGVQAPAAGAIALRD